MFAELQSKVIHSAEPSHLHIACSCVSVPFCLHTSSPPLHLMRWLKVNLTSCIVYSRIQRIHIEYCAKSLEPVLFYILPEISGSLLSCLIHVNTVMVHPFFQEPFLCLNYSQVSFKWHKEQKKHRPLKMVRYKDCTRNVLKSGKYQSKEMRGGSRPLHNGVDIWLWSSWIYNHFYETQEI